MEGGGGGDGGLKRKVLETLRVKFGHFTARAQLFYEISHNRHVTSQLAYRRMIHFSACQFLLTAQLRVQNKNRENSETLNIMGVFRHLDVIF